MLPASRNDNIPDELRRLSLTHKLFEEYRSQAATASAAGFLRFRISQANSPSPQKRFLLRTGGGLQKQSSRNFLDIFLSEKTIVEVAAANRGIAPGIVVQALCFGRFPSVAHGF